MLRLEAVVDLHGRDDGPTRLLHELCAARERLPGVPNVVCKQHVLALDLARVERPERQAARSASPERSRRVVVERREARLRVRQTAAAVQKTGDRMCE